ncbi:hypothetical protein GCM10007918_27220 [Piscinibacter gummiphilus]|nr:hypothetical protein GCM10007918_27220 [Piscinibacter gummiphilus]
MPLLTKWSTSRIARFGADSGLRSTGGVHAPRTVRARGAPAMKTGGRCRRQRPPEGKGLRGYFAVGIANSAPFAVLSAQRCITDFCFV